MSTQSSNRNTLTTRANDPVLQQMLDDFSIAPDIYQPSKFWISYASAHVERLNKKGLERFKRTINSNYFNWMDSDIKEQLKVVNDDFEGEKSWFDRSSWARLLYRKPVRWPLEEWKQYVQYLELLYEFTSKQDSLNILNKINEPRLGKPLSIPYGGRMISQDICNSVLEINAMAQAICNKDQALHIAELGGGYGRTSYILLKTLSNVRMTLIDIPPALHIAQWYLKTLFPEKKVFHYRPFDSYEEVGEEMEQSEIIFLLPHQVELLPQKSFDLIFNISSLHEMTHEQIANWYQQIDRLSNGFFYTKQWKEQTGNSWDNIVVKMEDYPTRSSWQEIFKRPCQVQPRFFEALYKI